MATISKWTPKGENQRLHFPSSQLKKSKSIGLRAWLKWVHYSKQEHDREFQQKIENVKSNWWSKWVHYSKQEHDREFQQKIENVKS